MSKQDSTSRFTTRQALRHCLTLTITLACALASSTAVAKGTFKIPSSAAAIHASSLLARSDKELLSIPIWAPAVAGARPGVWACDAYLRDGDKIIVDNIEQKKVNDLASVSLNTFYFDKPNSKLYIKSDSDPNTAQRQIFIIKSFRFFDAFNFKNKKNFDALGFEKINMIYSGQLWKGFTEQSFKDRKDLPEKAIIIKLAQEANSKKALVCLDVEHWPTEGDKSVVADSVTRYVALMESFRKGLSGVQAGYYSMLPVRDYHRAVKGPGNAAYAEWQTQNAALKGIADKADVIFPSAYTFYTDMNGWMKYAIAQIRESHLYGKPVYTFLWPQYHESNKLLGGKYLNETYWTLQMLTTMRISDGIVFWTPSREFAVSYSSEWWQATEKVMTRLKQ